MAERHGRPSQFGAVMNHEHSLDCPLFTITALAGGLVDVSVCWDQIDVPGVIQRLREIADGLDKAIGVIPHG